jgi:hypothetical protein
MQERIAAYEQEILRQLEEMEEPGQRGQTAPPLNNANKTKAIKNCTKRLRPSRSRPWNQTGQVTGQLGHRLLPD